MIEHILGTISKCDHDQPTCFDAYLVSVELTCEPIVQWIRYLFFSLKIEAN